MKLTLIEKKQETKDAFTFIFKPDEVISWFAGQYLIYSLAHENSDTRGKMRFFTISSSPFERNPSITTRIDPANGSSFKRKLLSLNKGDIIDAKGPDGDFIIEDYSKDYCFIAGGIGVTPFGSILKQLEFDKKDLNIEFLYSNSDKEFIFKEELDKLELKNLKIKYFKGQGIGEKQIKAVKDFKNRIFYISGPDPMVETLEKLLIFIGIDKENIKSDYFSGYLV